MRISVAVFLALGLSCAAWAAPGGAAADIVPTCRQDEVLECEHEPRRSCECVPDPDAAGGCSVASRGAPSEGFAWMLGSALVSLARRRGRL